MSADLKPCPFCGAKAEIERVGTLRHSTIYNCTDCGCRLETGEEWAHGQDWNTRAPDPAVAVLEAEVRALKEGLSDCGRQFQFYADLHAEAGKTERAEVNRRFAELCRALCAPSEKEAG